MGETIGMIKLFLAAAGLYILVGSTQAAADEYRTAGGGSRLAAAPNLPVPITLITSAVDKGAVCLDGTPPAYHMDPGFGAGKKRWIVNLEGGAWCDSVRACLNRKTSRLGSSSLMDKQMYFEGVMSSNPVDNPDFYSWNRVMVRYCDGASFAGEGYDAGTKLYFRGQRIFNATVEHLLSIGMASADQVLLAGGSAGALAVILQCDNFSTFFAGRRGTTVKCLADAGLFLDTVDISGGRTLRSYYGGVVATHGVAQNLRKSCTRRLDATSCFFPQNIIGSITTPMFLLNAAYDTWQIGESLAPDAADPTGAWRACKSNRSSCDASQMAVLQAFRDHLVSTVQGFSRSKTNGLFINSCFIHGQSKIRATWNAYGSPTIQNKGIAKSVGDWYFGRAEVKAIDCPYPCDHTCHHYI